MHRREIPEPVDMDRLFTGQNVFATCSDSERQALRMILERHRESLGILAVHAHPPFPGGLVPAGGLYGVLSGDVSLRWTSGAGKSLTFLNCTAGQVFGEVQCGLFGRAPISLGMELVPAHLRGNRPARLLEIPEPVVQVGVHRAASGQGLRDDDRGGRRGRGGVG